MRARILVLAAWLSPLAVAAPAPVEPVAVHTAVECEVWARELGFARSVAEHDATAFAEFLHPDAAFNSGQPVPLRGGERIAHDWAGIVDGKALALSWYPTRVTVGGNGDIAWSSGPALFERPQAEPAKRYAISQYQSVWQKGDDGTWRIVFGHGAGMKPVGEAEVLAFHAGCHEACPGG